MADQSYLEDPQHWRDRAAQVRGLADGIGNHRAKEAILQIAAEYDFLANRAQERAKARR
jgi:hypothetical protein